MADLNERWRVLDAFLVQLNSIDVSECKTPEDAKKLIYREAMKLRPKDLDGGR